MFYWELVRLQMYDHCVQITVTAATTCAVVWLARYSDIKHTFTVATVGMVSIAAYTISCAFLTMHEQVGQLCQSGHIFPLRMLLAVSDVLSKLH